MNWRARRHVIAKENDVDSECKIISVNTYHY